MPDFTQIRHKLPVSLDRPRELIVVCATMRSNVNLSNIARTASCCGVRRLICCGQARLVADVARDGAREIELEVHRTLPPVLAKLREEGFHLVGLEQTTGSVSLHD